MFKKSWIDHADFKAQKDKIQARTHRDPARKPYVAAHSHTHAVVNLEVKLKQLAFGITDSDEWEDFIPNTHDGRKARAQMCEFAAEAQLRQHRLFWFTVYIYRSYARLIRWDRVGAVVSRNIDLKTNALQLFDFFHRLGHASDEQLGFDPSVEMVDEEGPEAKSLKTALDAFPTKARVKPYIEKAFADKLWPLYRIAVPDKDDATKMHYFLIRNLRAGSASPTGRVTRGYIAFDLKAKGFRFLKDYWRPDSNAIHPELEVYRDLEKAAVGYIATVCCGGDLVGQETQTQSHLSGPKLPLRRIHTRMVLNEVGIPLEDYVNSYELCTTVAFALFGSFFVFLHSDIGLRLNCTALAHSGAWTQANILHRDISDGNIIIYEDPFDTAEEPQSIGLLIDWDLCKYKADMSKVATQKSRSVSPAFRTFSTAK